MPTITRLVAGKRNPNRVNIYIDGQFSLALSIDEVVKRGLNKDLELSEDQILALKETDADDKVYNLLLNFLSYRPRTVKEVRDRLYKYKIKDKDTQNNFIAKLTEKGYLDDLAFARWFITSRNTFRPRSPRRISQELILKGVSRETIQAVIAETADESETIKRLVGKKLGSPRKLIVEEKQKIYGYLGRQGFAWDKIKEVVKNWESE